LLRHVQTALVSNLVYEADVIYEDKDIHGRARWPERAQLATSSMRDKVIYGEKGHL
jgi:hypothetical protein